MQNLWLIWKNPAEKSRRRYRIGTLSAVSKDGQTRFEFKYENPELNDAIKAGFTTFPGFEKYDEEYVSKPNELFPSIAMRLPDPKRPDYLEILNNYDLTEESSDYEILTATRGRLRNDTFEFVPVFDEDKIEFDLAGTRHSDIGECKNDMNDDDSLELQLDPLNDKDDNAIKVFYNQATGQKRTHIGYVPRYYAAELAPRLKNKQKYSAMILKIRREPRFDDELVLVRVKLLFANQN